MTVTTSSPPDEVGFGFGDNDSFLFLLLRVNLDGLFEFLVEKARKNKRRKEQQERKSVLITWQNCHTHNLAVLLILT